MIDLFAYAEAVRLYGVGFSLGWFLSKVWRRLRRAQWTVKP